jgi:hypothetical protein
VVAIDDLFYGCGRGALFNDALSFQPRNIHALLAPLLERGYVSARRR